MQFWGRKWYFHQIKRKIAEGCKKASKLENILSIRLIELKELDTKNEFEKFNLPFLSKVSWVSSIRACVTNHPVYKHSLILAYQYLKKPPKNYLPYLWEVFKKAVIYRMTVVITFPIQYMKYLKLLIIFWVLVKIHCWKLQDKKLSAESSDDERQFQQYSINSSLWRKHQIRRDSRYLYMSRDS